MTLASDNAQYRAHNHPSPTLRSPRLGRALPLLCLERRGSLSVGMGVAILRLTLREFWHVLFEYWDALDARQSVQDHCNRLTLASVYRVAGPVASAAGFLDRCRWRNSTSIS